MTDIRAFKALSLLTTIGLVAVATCTLQLRGRDEAGAAPKADQRTDAANADLVHCRGVTPEETADYRRHCQQIWAENRRRFLGTKGGVVAPGHDDPTSSVPAQKDQSRIPQGYSNLATPEASKP
ncbi:conjugative transfer region protein TrbK [Bradyrhizobium sp. cir1]|uniref:putative entry exclusion protein TrbK-alt n=1 Tax=Bradyrhizobium sp. cir1 TaxID=1445730 RepID=UPI0016068D91|nr:putative entry exclusion protein TrbK-alt [Bradyrhizobium sp. cir1]MBB4368284.1 conjugative transfer region protein TrbK [Bradyrhizobium sp. cir1]